MNDVKEALYAIAADAVRGDMVFPTNAEIGLRVQKLLDDPDCSIDQLAKLISAEPVLLSRVIGIANSVAYNPSGQAMNDVRSAISRLGFNTLRILVMAVIVRQMQGLSQSPEHRAIAARLWEHTAHVAALARVIARRVTHQDPDAAFFAGIVHEIGGFYLISKVGRYPNLLNSGFEVWRDEGEARISGTILQILGVPEKIQEAISSLWNGYLSMPPQSLGDTLLLADQLSPVCSPLSSGDDLPQKTPPADLDMMIDDAMLSQVLAESAAEVKSLTDALNA
ncbi:HDOD domain-containing protein [Quatrionicoccus australiensis]|uniref:HDOD domain-containing protein n=1 Tax=Quatrionicoccus australiensis TaxID=138118 RepID=UPI001CF9D3C2|nr:HDOD domain-containing protein [Quatrionicoccus australiensis]MCB4358092.1 HDOD domain-containing protein [Quatrionicoccus australiensis]